MTELNSAASMAPELVFDPLWRQGASDVEVQHYPSKTEVPDNAASQP